MFALAESPQQRKQELIKNLTNLENANVGPAASARHLALVMTYISRVVYSPHFYQITMVHCSRNSRTAFSSQQVSDLLHPSSTRRGSDGTLLLVAVLTLLLWDWLISIEREVNTGTSWSM